MAAVMAASGSLGQVWTSRPAFAAAESARLAEGLLRIYPDRESASVIGSTFLEKLSEPPELGRVVQGLIYKLDISAQRVFTSSPRELRTRLNEKTSREFKLGQTAGVQGWVLAETEAWLCVLATLRA